MTRPGGTVGLIGGLLYLLGLLFAALQLALLAGPALVLGTALATIGLVRDWPRETSEPADTEPDDPYRSDAVGQRRRP